MRTFRDVIDEKARLSPAAPLLFAPEPQSMLTYDDLRHRARAFAGGMQGRGIAPDAIVGFMLPNGVAAASIFLSAMYSGYIVLPINLLAQDSQLYHINGQCIATVAPLVAGGSIVMPHRFSVSQWWPLVERYRPTWLNVVPTIIAYLLHGPDLTPAQTEACKHVRFVRSASAPLPPEQHRAFESRFGISILEGLGLTECASVAFANPLDQERRKIGSVGTPIAVEARVVAPDGSVLGDRQHGEIQVRGANVMLAYFR